MKLFAIVFTLMLTGVFGYAQQQTAATEKPEDVKQVSSTVVDQQEPKKEIQKEELPEKVVEEFNKSMYKDWSIDKVFLIENATATSYELHLTLEDQEMVLMADAEGNFQPKADS